MHHALRHLRDADALDAEQRDWVEARLETHAKHFAEGLSVVDGHAQLTPVGHQALAAARESMARA